MSTADRTSTKKTGRLALFIDGKTLSAEAATSLFEELQEKGDLIAARLYGADAAAWKHADILTTGEDAPHALALDVVETLQSRSLDGIVIASDDGRFSALALTIRAAGLAAYGFGTAGTPASYRSTFSDWTTLPDAAEKPAARRKAA